MDSTIIEREKIYVAVGNDDQEGFNALNWVLNKWNSIPISIVVLYVTRNISMDFVHTPFGKLPASSVNDKKLEVLRKYEQEKINKHFSKYISFCANFKVPAEIHEVEKCDEPIQKRIIDLIFSLGITKLVMAFSFMKPTLKSKGAISGLFYVHQHKPSFCELFIICGGKQVFLRGKNDEKIMEDDKGVMVAKMRDKITFKDWLEKMFNDNNNTNNTNISNESNEESQYRRGSTSTSTTKFESPITQSQWEFYLQEIENYYQELMMMMMMASSSNTEEGGRRRSCGQDNDGSQISPIEAYVSDGHNSNKSAVEKIEMLENKVNEAHKSIQMRRREAKDNAERHAKAQWAICLCNCRAEELESRIKEEVSTREEINKELTCEKEQTQDLKINIEENKRRLTSLKELQYELSNRLHVTALAKSRAETQLQNAVHERAQIVREIEELRKQRDVLNRRIEFCKQKDAIGFAARMSDTCCGFREYSEEELRLATENFSERLRLKSNVYRGRMSHSSVAIKMLVNSFHDLSHQDFQSKVRLLGDIRQPHVVATMGFCCEPKCILMEYMHNGSLRDMLFSRRRNRALKWHDRIRIAIEVCSGLGFLNSVNPRPSSHCHLSPANVLLDRNLVAKITGFGLHECNDKECNAQSDIRALGVLLMQLLTGRNWAGLSEEGLSLDIGKEALVGVLDETAGPWPLDLAKELAGLAMRYMAMKDRPNCELSIARVMDELKEIRRKGDEIVAKEGRRVIIGEGIEKDDISSDVPSVFLCPILQDVMKNPHVAADGFSYELEAMERWLQSGHDTSPLTNLRLKHTILTPNHSLRSLIEDWRSSNISPKLSNQ